MEVGWSNVHLSRRFSTTLYYNHVLVKCPHVSLRAQSPPFPLLLQYCSRLLVAEVSSMIHRQQNVTLPTLQVDRSRVLRMAAVKYQHKIEYIDFSERTQNILSFELSVNPLYLECRISRNPGVYSLSSPTLHNRDFGLNPALWLCFRISHPRALSGAVTLVF